jgi:hypothetical protein
MSDDLKNRGPQDRARVNVHEDWERRWWCEQYGVNEERLKEAVEKVGVSAEKVKEYLGVK